MPANNVPITPRWAFGKSAKLTTAQTDQTGATAANIVTIYTFNAAGAPPAAIDGQGGQCLGWRVRVPVTSVAAVVNLYRKSGGVRYLLDSYTVPIVAVAVGTPGADSTYRPLPPCLFIAGDSVEALTTVTQETHVDTNLAEY